MNPETSRARATSGTRPSPPRRSLSQLSSEELMNRYLDGDVKAFNQIHARHSGVLFGYLLKKTRHREQAEDLVQITFAKVHRARESYLRGAPLLPWMLAIAKRSFLDEYRAQRVRHEALSRDGEVPEGSARGARGKIELTYELDRALAGLPAANRDAIVLTKVFGYSGDEAAAALETTSGAIKLRVHRGRRQLREALDEAA